MTFSRIFILREVADLPEVNALRARLGVPADVIRDLKEAYAWVCAADDPIQRGKETLVLTRNRGSFIRSCPGTRAYTCCGYKILHTGTYCHMDCTYCILQSYFHPPVLQYFANHDDLVRELDAQFRRNTRMRIGTGEFTDSLIWESWTDLSGLLVPQFARQKRAVLELKTKTTTVAAFKKYTHNRKTILAWSMNTPTIIANEERRTAPLAERIRAAATCAGWGYPVAFHFDPMVIYEGCEQEYRQVLMEIFARIDPADIIWISLGTFRFMPALKPIIQKRFPGSQIVYGEFVAGLDGKMRYFKPLRIELYRKIVGWIREVAPNVRTYLCMESNEVWQKVFGFVPAERGGLPHMLDESAAEHCGLD